MCEREILDAVVIPPQRAGRRRLQCDILLSASPSLYLPVSPSPITDSLNRFLFSACGIIPVTTEAPDNEILNSSHFLSLSASPAADAVPVRKDGDQVKCYYLLKKKKKNLCLHHLLHTSIYFSILLKASVTEYKRHSGAGVLSSPVTSERSPA